MICATYVRRFLPDTFTANLLFLLLFFSGIVAVIWLSLRYYSRTSTVKWMSLSLMGVISSIIAALLVTAHGFMYSRFSDPYYFDEILQFSKQEWARTNSAAESLIGDWSWFNNTFDYALYNFRDLIVALFLISLTIAAIFYIRNRNRKRAPDEDSINHHELIY